MSGAGAPGDGIAVTPEMVEAGISALAPLDRDLWEQSSPERLWALVTAIYVAMRRCDLSDGGFDGSGPRKDQRR